MPLSKRAVQVLGEALALADGSGLLFPSLRRKPVSNMTLIKLSHELRIGYGFRSSFRDWCSEATDAPREVAEQALAHVNPNRFEAGRGGQYAFGPIQAASGADGGVSEIYRILLVD